MSESSLPLFSEMSEREILNYGIELFNSGKYYKCHDVMEHLWGHGTDSLRPFYQGILQLAVALYHFENKNTIGAESLLKSGMALLENFRASKRDIDVEDLYRQATELLCSIRSGSSDQPEMMNISRKGK